MSDVPSDIPAILTQQGIGPVFGMALRENEEMLAGLDKGVHVSSLGA